MFCCTLLYIHSSIAIILMGKRELVALLNLSSWCLVVVEQLFLVVPWGCLRFVIVVFPDHAHLLFLVCCLVCSLQSCDHQLEKWLTSWLFFALCFLVFLSLSHGVPGHVWYLIKWIPDVCLLLLYLVRC